MVSLRLIERRLVGRSRGLHEVVVVPRHIELSSIGDAHLLVRNGLRTSLIVVDLLWLIHC
jgi:hypothetical protein